MKKDAQLALLEKTIKALGYKIRYEKGSFLGGACRIKEDKVVVVNKFLPIEGKLYTLAQVIANLNLANLPMEVEKIISRHYRQQLLFPPSNEK
uniref:Uncharacterized protein n=1 Tax=Chlorobium chlorochromatii (strain CaD3) TaxID=340177 RepID=Q3ARF5_CHLCH